MRRLSGVTHAERDSVWSRLHAPRTADELNAQTLRDNVHGTNDNNIISLTPVSMNNDIILGVPKRKMKGCIVLLFAYHPLFLCTSASIMWLVAINGHCQTRANMLRQT